MKIKIICLVFLFTPFLSFADTSVDFNSVLYGGHWTRDKSPYHVTEDIRVSKGHLLTIDAGVEVRFAPDSSLGIDGDLQVNGTDDNQTTFASENIYDRWQGIYVGGGTLDMKGALIRDAYNALYLLNSTSTIKDSTFQQNDTAINAQSGFSNITDSIISHNLKGVVYRKFVPVYLMFNPFGSSKVFADETTTSYPLSITNSTLVDNSDFNIQNNDNETTLDATHSYWGSPDGPGSTIIGSVLSDPWLIADPTIKKLCCSNILFIPGFEGTRLFKENNQLWEPNRNADVDKLHLNDQGQSVDASIKIGGIIKRTNIGFGAFDQNIYQSFSNSLDDMVASGTIKEWFAYPYDWRLDLPISNLVEKVTALASSSITKKISLVSHSNGGLLAKKLMNILKDKGLDNLIDKIIFVAVPQIGAPSAIGAVLNGEEQQIAGGLIMNKATAKSFGQNLIGAYNLLPSQSYFNKSIFPIISFSGNVLSSFRSFWDFVTSSSSPSLLRANLLGIVETNHSTLDSWKPPSWTKIFQIAGTSLPTTRGVEYGTTTHKLIQSSEGDSVVPVQSSLFMDALSYVFNIKNYQKDHHGNFSHASIFEASPILDLIKNIVMGSPVLPAYISTSTPQVASTFELRQYSVHSPVSLDLYDAKGNHTGLVKSPDPNSDLYFVQNDIPGSVYQEVGDAKYISIADDIPVKVVINGTGLGTFTFEIEDQYTDNSSTTMAYADIPVVYQTVATLDSSNTTAPKNSLIVDADGDGVSDIAIAPNVPLTDIQKLGLIKLHIKTYGLEAKLQKGFEQKIDTLINLYKKNKDKKFENKIKKFISLLQLHKFINKKLSSDEKTALISDLNDLIN